MMQTQRSGNPRGDNAIDPSSYLWFSGPATKWDEALPVGNGRLGAMVFGGVEEERLQLNEDTYWSGGPYSTVVKGGYKFLPEIQRLVFAEKYLDAHNLFVQNWDTGLTEDLKKGLKKFAFLFLHHSDIFLQHPKVTRGCCCRIILPRLNSTLRGMQTVQSTSVAIRGIQTVFLASLPTLSL